MKPRFSQDIWVIVIIVAFLLGFGYFAARKQTTDIGMEVMVRRTTYSPTRYGMKALYETLGELHYPVQRMLHPLTRYTDDGVLFIVSPETPITEYEWRSLYKWVEKGNLLIIADDDAFAPEPDLKVKTARSIPSSPSFLSPGVNYYCTEKGARVAGTHWSFGKDSVFGSGNG